MVDEFVLLTQDGKRLTVDFALGDKSQLVIDTEKIPSGEYRPGFKTQKRAFLFLPIGGKHVQKSKKFKVLPRPCPPGKPVCHARLPLPPENCELPPSDHDRCIIFANQNWDSARLQTAIARKIVQYGYRYPTATIPSENVPANTRALWRSLVRGNHHVTMEIWLPNQQSVWNEAISRSMVIPLGRSMDDVWQSAFVIPTYVIKGDASRGITPLAPELETVHDLRKYHKAFASTMSNGKGVAIRFLKSSLRPTPRCRFGRRRYTNFCANGTLMRIVWTPRRCILPRPGEILTRRPSCT